jgi:transcriptional regulator with GAF, ATPase, and Fis domain
MELPSDPPPVAGRAAADLPASVGRLEALWTETLRSLAPGMPFDRAELALLELDGRVRLLTGSGATRSAARSAFSPRLWPASPTPSLVPATADALDPSCAGDRAWLESDARALAVVPLHDAGREIGLLVLASHGSSFAPDVVRLLGPVAALLGPALERERRWALEESRHHRRVRLEAALPTIARSLDVRTVFAELSPLVREVLPHDVLAFALLEPDRRGVRVQAATERGVLELPPYRFSNAEEALDANWQFLLAYDLELLEGGAVRARISPRSAAERREVVTRPGPAWQGFLSEARVRSVLRVPIRSQERPIGGLAFLSRAPDAYEGEDGLVAARLADQLALALAHQELAEEERRMALAEERARALERRVELLSGELARYTAHRAIGRSAPWRKALADAAQVAATEATVLITGESGTGKEVIARAIHRGSKRQQGPFVALNCAALPEQLMESELFGHERGAFTGANEARAGRIEQAAGGVLFLDEVGEMSPAVQAKFLRVLQEREFQRVGGSKVLRAEVRIVAATNRDPRAAIERGEFREDLYYRLGVFEIHLPPLRERPEDIPVLAEAFLEEIGRTIGRPAAGLSEDAREQLLSHPWPGNVRELRNAIERAVILCQGGLVTREHLPSSLTRPPAERFASVPPSTAAFPVEGVQLSAVERELLVAALERAGQNKSQAARLLGLNRGQLYSLLRRHGLTDAKR